MPSLTAAELPPDVADIVTDVATFLDLPVAELFVADHTHEELSAGAYSVAYEGAYDWPHYFIAQCRDAAHAEGRRAYYPTRHLEAGAGWFLAVYPVTEQRPA